MVFAGCQTCIYSNFPFVFFFTVCLVRDLSFWLYLCCAQQEKGSLSGETVEATAYTSNNRKERGREEEEGEEKGGLVAGDPIKIFDKHRSTQRQKKNMNRDDIISQGVVFRGCCAACCVNIIKMLTAVLDGIIKEFAPHIST